jgi:hypothetical protein
MRRKKLLLLTEATVLSYKVTTMVERAENSYVRALPSAARFLGCFARTQVISTHNGLEDCILMFTKCNGATQE